MKRFLVALFLLGSMIGVMDTHEALARCSSKIFHFSPRSEAGIIRDDGVYTMRGAKIGIIRGDTLLSPNGKKLGTFNRDTIFDMKGKKIGIYHGNVISDIRGKKLGTLDGNCSPAGAALIFLLK